jgi:hypothetical protein
MIRKGSAHAEAAGELMLHATMRKLDNLRRNRKRVCSSSIPGFEAADVMEFAMTLRHALGADGILSLVGVAPIVGRRCWSSAVLYDFLNPSEEDTTRNCSQALQYIPRKSRRAWMMSFDDTVDPPQYELDGDTIVGGISPHCRIPVQSVVDGSMKLDTSKLAQLAVSFVVKPIDTKDHAFDVGMFPHRYNDVTAPSVTRRLVGLWGHISKTTFLMLGTAWGKFQEF